MRRNTGSTGSTGSTGTRGERNPAARLYYVAFVLSAKIKPWRDDSVKVEEIFKSEKIEPKNAQKRAVHPYKHPNPAPYVGRINIRDFDKRVTIFPFSLRFSLRFGLGIAENRFTTDKKSQNFQKGYRNCVKSERFCSVLERKWFLRKKNFA